MKRGMSVFSILILVVCGLLLHCGLPDLSDLSRTSMVAVFKNAESKVFGTSMIFWLVLTLVVCIIMNEWQRYLLHSLKDPA